MKKQLIGFLVAIFIGLLSIKAFAVPVLQVGAPAGHGDTGLYADYQTSPTPPPIEADTAITSGSVTTDEFWTHPAPISGPT